MYIYIIHTSPFTHTNKYWFKILQTHYLLNLIAHYYTLRLCSLYEAHLFVFGFLECLGSICVFPLLYFIDLCLLNYNLAILNTYVKQEVNGYFVNLNY